MTRKRLDQKGKEFIYGSKAQSPFQDNNQSLEQSVEQTLTQKPTQHNSLLAEILPQKEPTQRFCVDLPESLSKRLTQLSKQSGIPKTEIVRRLLIKALEID